MWNGTLVMISFAVLGEAAGDGEVSGVGKSVEVGEALAEGLAAALGEADGELEVWLKGWVQAASDRTKPTAIVAGTLPLHTVS
jgi:hypothetical protein